MFLIIFAKCGNISVRSSSDNVVFPNVVDIVDKLFFTFCSIPNVCGRTILVNFHLAGFKFVVLIARATNEEEIGCDSDFDI